MSYNYNNQNQGYQQNVNYMPQNMNQPMNMQNQNQISYGAQNQNVMIQQQSQNNLQKFLDIDLYNLTEDCFDAQTFVSSLVEEAYQACNVFTKKKQQIVQIISELKQLQNKQNNHNMNQEIVNQFQKEIDAIEEDTRNIIIQKRINDMKDVENFLQLAEGFEIKNIQLIYKIKNRLDNNGVLNLDPQEYLEWLEVIKESQLKLNIITGYSNIIYNTKVNIEQFSKIVDYNTIQQKLEKFEEEQINHIKGFKIQF